MTLLLGGEEEDIGRVDVDGQLHHFVFAMLGKVEVMDDDKAISVVVRCPLVWRHRKQALGEEKISKMSLGEWQRGGYRQRGSTLFYVSEVAREYDV